MLYKFLRASDGTGPAVLANIQSNRAIAATVIDVDNVDNWPQDFIVTTGTLGANGYILEATKTEMRGHLNAGDIIIDGFEPGFPDLGNTAGQKAVIKPTTGFADSVVTNALVSHNDDGTIKNDAITTEAQFTDNVDPVKRMSELMFDHVASGLVWTGDSYGVNRAASMTAGVIYVNGKRVTVTAVVSRVFTASKDTYIDVGEDGVVDYTEVANNAASLALAASHIRVGVIVTAAGSIAASTSIANGNLANIVPVISSRIFTEADSLGNIIYPAGAFRNNKIVNPYKFSVYRAAAWGTAGVATKVQFDTKRFDSGNNYDAVTNHRFTAPVAGFYQFNVAVHCDTSNGGNNQQVLYLFKNGAQHKILALAWTPAVSSSVAVPGSALVQLAAGDYVEIFFLQNFGTGGQSGSASTWFEGYLVSRI